MQEINNLDTVSTLLVGMIGTFAVVAGSMSAVGFVRRSRVHLARARKGTFSVLAERPSMIVDAQNKMSEDLILRFKLTDPAITLFRIELANQLDKAVGAIECVKIDLQIFIAPAGPTVVQRWYNANPYWRGETKQLPIRVFMGDGGHALCRTIWVMVSPVPPHSGPIDIDNFTWLLDGPC